jgi:hypothetical protein
VINIQPFIDSQTGLVAGADGGRDNETLDTATFKFLQKELSPAMNQAIDQFLNVTRVSLGVWRRYPNASDNSVDNYVGIAYLSSGYAKTIQLRGENSFWCFNISNPNKFALRFWFGRFLGFAPFIRASATGKMGLIDAFFYAITCFLTSLSAPENTSDKCLQILMNDRVKGLHWLSDLGIKAFNSVMRRKYPRGVQSVYSIYFGPNHPFTLAAPCYF